MHPKSQWRMLFIYNSVQPARSTYIPTDVNFVLPKACQQLRTRNMQSFLATSSNRNACWCLTCHPFPTFDYDRRNHIRPGEEAASVASLSAAMHGRRTESLGGVSRFMLCAAFALKGPTHSCFSFSEGSSSSANYVAFPTCNGTTRWISDGWCDADNNNAVSAFTISNIGYCVSWTY